MSTAARFVWRCIATVCGAVGLVGIFAAVAWIAFWQWVFDVDEVPAP